MSKKTVWFVQLPLLLLWTIAFLVVQWGDAGTLRSPVLRNHLYPALRTMSGWLTDRKFRLRGARPPKQKIVIVEIDDPAIAMLGRWPWHRDAVAVLIQSALEAGAKVVGLDIVFSEPDTRVPEGVADLMKSKGLADQIPAFETDLMLQRVIDVNRDKLVLAWWTDRWCYPAFDRPCAVTAPEEVARQPKDFQKFAYGKVTGTFDSATTSLMSTPEISANLDGYDASALHVGYLTGAPDADGVVRRAPLAMLANGRPYPTLPLEMARVILGDELTLAFDRKGFIERIGFQRSARAIPVEPTGFMSINFRGAGYHFPYVPAVQLLGEDEQIQFQKDAKIETGSRKEIFKDAYVFIGVTAIGARDLRNFPFGTNIPGVEGHATVLDNILSGDPMRTGAGPCDWRLVLVLMTLGALLFGLAMLRLDAMPAMLLFLVVVGVVAVLDVAVVFARHDIDLNTIFLFAQLTSVFLVTLVVKYILEERSKKFIHGAFSKYLAPAVIQTMLDDPSKLKVGGVKKELTILFSDIRGFSTFSEKMDAPTLASFLNEYLGMMTEIVFEEGGTLDKYIGDAVMAFWGAPVDDPLHAARCARAARRMQQALTKNREHYQTRYAIRVDAGIGLHTGAVNVGNMGSDRIFEYTVIGDHVNLASRLEGLTKYYRAGIITTRASLDAMKGSGQPLPDHRVLDEVKVKGKKVAVEIIQLLEQPLPEAGLLAFAEARQLYHQRKWTEAIAQFHRASEIIGELLGGGDGPSELYVERCQDFQKEPPAEDWDGSWEMTSK